jgi:hypothetical protein
MPRNHWQTAHTPAFTTFRHIAKTAGEMAIVVVVDRYNHDPAAPWGVQVLQKSTETGLTQWVWKTRFYTTRKGALRAGTFAGQRVNA